MKRSVSLALALLILVSLLAIPAFADQSVPKKVLAASKSVVCIESEYTDSYATGSGFVIYSDNKETLIATNYHVVEDSPLNISVYSGDDTTVSAKMWEFNKQADICILKTAYPLDIPALPLNGDTIKQGDAVYAVGFPAAADILSDKPAHTSEEATITNGIISAIRQSTIVEYGSSVELLQINAAINSGNSGGPLFNKDGQVVGINTLGVLDSQGIFGAVSINELIEIMNDNDIPVKGSAFNWMILVYVLSGLLILGAIVLLVILLVKKRHIFKRKKKEQPVTLKVLVESRPRPLSAQEAVTLLMPLAVELKNLHDSGIAHLEVSPEHITVANGKALLQMRTGLEANTYSNGYTAPEIYHGRNYGAKSDLYSFCAVLRFAITGIQPMNALSRTEESTPVQDAEATAIDVREILAITEQGMRIDAAERLDTMQSLIYTLTPYNTGVGITNMNAQPAASATSSVIPAAAEVSTEAQQPHESVTETGKKERKKNKKKAKPAIVIPVCVGSVLLLAVAAYFGCYFGAVKLAEKNEFAKAQKLIFIKPLTELHDEYFVDYLEAGSLMADRDYETAIDTFAKLHGYRETDNLLLETYYRYAMQCADANDFHTARQTMEVIARANYKDSDEKLLEIKFRQGVYWLYEEGNYELAMHNFTSLVNEGYEGAQEMANECIYLQALDMVDNGYYIKAYDALEEIRDYSDVNETLDALTEIMYLEGQTQYQKGEYYTASEYFNVTIPYKESYEYTILCRAHQGTYSDPLTMEMKLKEVFYFEDAAELLVSDTDIACYFLWGDWRTSNGSYYYKMNHDWRSDLDDFTASYNIPGNKSGSFTIEDGIHYAGGKKMYRFTLISPDCMDVYSYGTGKTYTLYRSN